MKFTLSWLKDHLDTDASLAEITEKLTDIGLEVEGVEDRASTYAPFAVAYVESAKKHPDADRLQVLEVNTGKEKLQVVCGAPNAKAGMKGIFAPVGSYIPGLDIELKKGVIRGVESCGMMASERELCLSDEHTGIIELDEKWEIGTPMAEIYGLDDPVIEICLTPNRADCAGVRGIARDLAAAGLGRFKDINESPVKGNGASPIKVHLDFDNDNKDACPLFIGRYIKGVKNGPSPEWMQRRLKAIGLRPISALVDVTNYLSYDLCRPLHVFDADKIRGDLRLRLSRQGETFQGLDGNEYTLEDGMTAICDDSGVINMAGIMGGEDSGCSEDTVNVFLEVAYFDPPRTAKTGRALQISSDARYRFERGLDPAFTVPAAEIATRLIMELCGGEAMDVYQAGEVPETARTITFDPAYVEKLAGFSIEHGKQKDILSHLGFKVTEEANGKWAVEPPSWRADVEGRSDLVEEIVRIYGYDNIPPVSMQKQGSAVTQPAETISLTRARKARTALAARGLSEAITWSFMDESLADTFGANDHQSAVSLKLKNPISSDLAQMRPSILPNLIEAAGRNRDRGNADCALFEVGPVFRSVKPDGEDIMAAGIRAGNAGPRHWSGKHTTRAVDVFDVKADALDVLERSGAPAGNAQITQDAPEWYHPGRSGTLRLGPNVLAHFGEIHPQVLEDMGIKTTVAGFEVFLNHIPQPKKKAGPARPLLELSAFQPLSRDFAFIVDEKVKTADIIRAAKGADKQLICDAAIFDVYTGTGVEEGKKSVALSIIIQPSERTLRDEEIESLSNKVIENVIKSTGGQLRG